MARKKPLPLQLTDEHQPALFTRSAMPISLTNKRLVQSAKENAQRERPIHASAHHLRQIAKLKEAASITKPANSTMLDQQSVQKQLMQATTKLKLPPSPNPMLSPINLQRPQSTGAFKARKIERTRFRYFYDRGDLPLRVNFAGAVRKLQWQVDVSKLDYAHYLPMFMEGLRELDEPYHFLAISGTMDLLEKGDGKPLTCLPLIVLPMKQNLMTRNHKILCVQMKVLQRLVQCCPYAGEALVPYYRQLLSIFNLFIAKRVNCGDAIDYGQRRQENLGDLILETLNILERHGGPDAFVNIKKYMMKKRPVLTVIASEDVDSDGLLRPPQPTIKSVYRQRSSDSKDGDTSDEDDDDGDALENSCDIGETSLKKGPLHINRAGVTFLPIDEHSDGSSDTARPKSSGSRPASSSSSSSSFKPLSASPPRRRTQQITLDELQTCGLIGRGCSGHVMKATHKSSGQFYALKIVNNVYDKSKRDQMLTEIRTLYSVDSAYLVQFYGAYFSDHQLSLVLEFCAAGSLDKVIAQRAPVPEPIVACMAFQMLHGLRDLKKTNHFHRDIKPQNILVQADGRVKLTDFGIARELGHSQDMAQTFVGTFKYMSPERVQNEPYDYKSDIWSMGLVLIELATKMFPFRNARSYIDVVQSIIECTEPSLPPNTPELRFSSSFREFIGLCVRKDPKQRGSVDELLASHWLRQHHATEGERSARRVMRWLDGHEDDDAKPHSEEKEDEIEEDIEEDLLDEDAK